MPNRSLPLKTAVCCDCESEYAYRTNRSQRCPECRVKNRRRVAQEWKVNNREKARAWYWRAKEADPERLAARYKANYEKTQGARIAYSVSWNRANPEKRKATIARYGQTHKDQRREAQRSWRKANPEKVRARKRRQYWADPQKARERRRAQYRANPEEAKARARAWSEANPERVRARQRAWSKANPEKVRAASHRRRAVQKGATIGPHFTRLEIAERDGWRCHLCGEKVTRKNWSLDHLVPLSKGGAHSRENVAVAHYLCNVRRNNRGVAQLRLIG